MTLRHEPSELAALADDDVGIEGKSASQFSAKLRLGDWPPDHERTRRADIHRIEMLQLFCERSGSEGPVTADVDSSQKNHECHAFPPVVIFTAANRLRLTEGILQQDAKPGP